ncbi:MAG: ribbon-helix-helix domain-containing protein [Magnetococcus sp. DMHC-6]
MHTSNRIQNRVRPLTGATLRRRHGDVKIQVCVKLPEEIVAHLDQLVAKNGSSRSQVVLELITHAHAELQTEQMA